LGKLFKLGAKLVAEVPVGLGLVFCDLKDLVQLGGYRQQSR
jgi:hypothetical protein